MRKPLGRGLDALIGDVGGGESGGSEKGAHLTTAPVGDIRPGPFQPRIHFDEERLEELKRAIQSQGIIEPLIVRLIGAAEGSDGPRYELIAGERRLRAARAAGLEAVPIVVRELDDRAALGIAAVGISARGAEEMTEIHRPPKSKLGGRSSNDPNMNALAEGLQRALKRKVRVFKRRGRSPGRIEIEYYDEND